MTNCLKCTETWYLILMFTYYNNICSNTHYPPKLWLLLLQLLFGIIAMAVVCVTMGNDWDFSNWNDHDDYTGIYYMSVYQWKKQFQGFKSLSSVDACMPQVTWSPSDKPTICRTACTNLRANSNVNPSVVSDGKYILEYIYLCIYI